MPGTRCAVAICKNSLQNTKANNLKISYHTFPKDVKLQKIWVNACHRKDLWNPKTSVICSSHFNEEDFETDLRASLMNIKTRRRLKPLAVPSRNCSKHESSSSTPRNERIEKRQTKELVQTLLAEMKVASSANIQNETAHYEMGQNNLDEPLENIQDRYKILQNRYRRLKQDYNEQQKKIDLLEQQLSEMSKKYENSCKSKEDMENVLRDYFSPTQLDVIINKKKRVIWKTDDISKAFTLRYLSQRCYVYLRNTLKYPLPHTSTLKKWAARLDFRSGMLRDVLQMMKIATISKSELQKIAVLQFDEIKVESIYEYDRSKDEILGPHNHMQVIMVRGLFDNWKQPIFLDFDQKMTKDILFNAISQLHDVGYKVVACVSDCGGGNIGLWRDLEISPENSFFLHPKSNEKIYFFADVPHLLKLIRNWLLDSGFILDDGSIINKLPLEELLQLIVTEISVCHKLTRKHLDCTRTERQNVGLAAQLLSHSTATALLHYKPGTDKNLAINTGNFIDLVSTWFDIMNSYSPNQSLHIKKPYGLMLKEQNETLDKMYNTFSKMKCTGKNSLQVFQKGVLISISSLKALYEDMKSKFNITYLLTHRLNQDSLESFFSQIRSRGGLHDHPSPLNAIYRMRLIVLGKNPGLIQNNINIHVEAPNEEYLVASVLTKSNITISENQLQQFIPQTSEGDQSASLSSSSTSTNSSKSNINISTCEDDGFKYLCGWIARKYRNKYPYLGKYTKDVCEDHSYVVPDWLQHLSFGGLTTPSEQWLKQATTCEKYFRKFHGKSLRRGKAVTRKLVEEITKKETDLEEEIIRSYIIQRTYIRVKYLNEKTKIDNQKRKYVNSDSEKQKICKKMRKIVT